MRRCRDLSEWLVLAWRQYENVVAQMSRKVIAQIGEASHEPFLNTTVEQNGRDEEGKWCCSFWMPS